MKRVISFLFVLCICFAFCSCGKVDKDCETPELVIAEHYKIAWDYEQIEPLLKEYFLMVEEAYTNSDKQNLDTFVLSDRFDEVVAALERIDNSMDISGIISSGDQQQMIAYQKQLALLEPFLRIQLKISEKNLLKLANPSNKEWFDTFSVALSEAYEQYNSEEE